VRDPAGPNAILCRVSDTPSQTHANRREGRLRENLSAFAIAIAVTVLFKYFVIEAYQIPTSSMQPTLMGSQEAAVYDRLLVDKRPYEVHEPKRWDVAVFRYPIRELQNYVKRIVGVGGDRLRIGSGNVYLVKDGTDGVAPADREVLRKPEAIQEQLWRELFPAGLDLYGGTALDAFFSASPSRSWEPVDGERDAVRLSKETRVARLTYGAGTHKLLNDVYDGYPTAVARAIKDAYGGQRTTSGRSEFVRDVRLDATIEPEGELGELRIELEAKEIGGRRVTYALSIENGKGELRALVDDDQDKTLRSEPFDAAIPAGRATKVRFEHRDDLMRVWLDGEPARLARHAARQHADAARVDPGQQRRDVDRSAAAARAAPRAADDDPRPARRPRPPLPAEFAQGRDRGARGVLLHDG
jgi:signal peptidase I